MYQGLTWSAFSSDYKTHMESRDGVKALAGEPTCRMEFLIPNLSDLLYQAFSSRATNQLPNHDREIYY